MYVDAPTTTSGAVSPSVAGLLAHLELRAIYYVDAALYLGLAGMLAIAGTAFFFVRRYSLAQEVWAEFEEGRAYEQTKLLLNRYPDVRLVWAANDAMALGALLASALGSRGIWWGIPAGWLVGFTANFLYYLGGRWKRKVVARPVSAAAEP